MRELDAKSLVVAAMLGALLGSVLGFAFGGEQTSPWFYPLYGATLGAGVQFGLRLTGVS